MPLLNSRKKNWPGLLERNTRQKTKTSRKQAKSTDEQQNPAPTRRSPRKKKQAPAEQQTETEDEETAKDATTPTRRQWKRCRAKKITNRQRDILSKEFTLLFKNGKDHVSFLFAERSMQEYAGMQRSPLHINARKLYIAAIGQVMRQVVPSTDRPLKGNVTKIFDFDLLFPICQKVNYYC